MAHRASNHAGLGDGLRRAWSPEQAALFEFELCRLLSTDRGAQSVYFRKLAVLRSAHCSVGSRGDGVVGGSAGGAIGRGGAAGSRRRSARAGGTMRGRAGGREAAPPATAMDLDASAGEDTASSGAAAAGSAPPPAGMQQGGRRRRDTGDRLERKWRVRRCVWAAAPVLFGRKLEPAVLAVALAFLGRCRLILHGDVHTLLRLREMRAAHATGAVLTSPLVVRGAAEDVGSVSSVGAACDVVGVATSPVATSAFAAPACASMPPHPGPTALAVGSGGIPVVGGFLQAALADTATDGFSALFGGLDHETLLREVAAAASRSGADAAPVYTLRDLRGAPKISWADQAEAEDAQRGQVRPRARGTGGSSSADSDASSTARPTSKQLRGGLSRSEFKAEASARRVGVRPPVGGDG